MNVLIKIRKHGVYDSLKILALHIVNIVNNIIYYICSVLFPINNKLIILESEGDLSDNAYALFDYMKKNGYLSRYKVVWMVDNIVEAKKQKYKNTVYAIKVPYKIEFLRSYYLATCKWYIYDHCNFLADKTKRKNQFIIYLSHGWGYKAAKGNYSTKPKTTYDYLTATGPLAAKGLSDYWNESDKKAILTGYPRIDYLFQDNYKVRIKLNQKWSINKYDKIIFWMPTFRKSTNLGLSENYNNSETGLPIFYTKEELNNLSDYLKTNNYLLVLKLHHLQAELPIFNEVISNVLVIRDDDIKNLNLQLYQVISIADIMISDYSSISIDYLVLNRPIIYTLDDYEEYDKSRGLYPKNAIDYMPGYHIYNVKELLNSIDEICSGVDVYSKDRELIIPKYHKYLDGNSSKRILNKFGIY